jgi:endonuclease/exonuclease/phosphatase family metal-dependent hydrolase
VRVATFNLENLSDPPDGNITLEARCSVLRPQLVALNADILCLQEVGAEHSGPKGTPRQFRALSKLLEGTNYADFHRAHSLLPDGHGPLDVHNLVILSRYPIIRHRQFWNDLVLPPRHKFRTSEPAEAAATDILWDRPSLYAEIRPADGHSLHVFNLHLKAPLATFVHGQKIDQFKWRSVSGWAEGFYVAALKRNGQALEIRFAIDEIFDSQPDALIAVCGDLNAELREMPLRILRGDAMDTENPDLENRVMIPMEEAEAQSRRYSVIHGGRPSMLDHVLVSRPLFKRFEAIEIHNENLHDELLDYQRAENQAESHHAPVVANFNF